MRALYFTVLLFIVSFLVTSCKKEIPVSTNIFQPPPQRPEPPVPSASSSASCPNSSGVCIGTNPFTAVNYSWSDKIQWPGSNGAAVSTVNKIFFAGGHGDVIMEDDISSVGVYNGDSKPWDELFLSIPRSHLSGINVGSVVLFAGGKTSQCTYCGNNLYYYDQVDIFDANTQVRTSAQLSEPRSNMASVRIGENAFFIGGKTLLGYSKKMDVYNAVTGTWSVVQLPTSRGYAGAAVIENKIYICGGKNDQGNLKTIDVYDAITGIWSVFDAPNEHPYATVIALVDKLFIAGGDNLANKSLDIFNTTTKIWNTMQLSDSRYDMAVAAANNKIIFLGGNYSEKIDIYDNNSNTLSYASLTQGAAGMKGTSFQGKCYFSGFLFHNGGGRQSWMIVITP